MSRFDKSYRSYTKRFTISFVTTSQSGWSPRWLLVEPELLAVVALHFDFKTVVGVTSARTDLRTPRATRLLRNIKYGSVLHLMVSVAVTVIGVFLLITVEAVEEIRAPPYLKVLSIYYLSSSLLPRPHGLEQEPPWHFVKKSKGWGPTTPSATSSTTTLRLRLPFSVPWELVLNGGPVCEAS